ncbi:MAG: hypothetical protein HYW26_03695 [Candidatus Aenigmarchaeota archaeon]|nr:hypothetical protein [Candidatus Aenigmarchaeota archaeon]
MKNLSAILLAAVLVSGCVQPLEDFAFASKSGCAAGEENIEIEGNISEVIVSGIITTPTPCYDLKVSGEKSGNEAVIKIETVSKGGVCIQCVGGHDFYSSFKSGNGTYTVKVFVNGRLAKQQEIITG